MPSGAELFPTFTPALATIIAISNSTPTALVQAAFPVTFIAGEYVRFIIPQEYGMTQLNNVVALITFVLNALGPSPLFIVDVDTSNFDAFIVPAVPLQSAQAVPVGEVATTLLGATKNVLPYP